jgi:tight adherence protein C
MQEIGFMVGALMGAIIGNAADYLAVGIIGGALLGMFYPQIWLNDQIKVRQLKITRALPYNLDLLTLSVEAGLDFTGALGKVVEKGKTGPLREEFQMVLKQLKMGKTREEALKMMVARVDLPALTTFVTALIQADKMGTSLGKVLRIQSTQLRIERTQRAEKLANEAPVKMLFPLVACIFPTVFMVLFGPIVFAFMYGNQFS